MAVPAIITHTGSLSGTPSSGTEPLSLQELMNTSFSGTYQSSKSARPSINSTDGSPFSIPFETITKVRFFAIRARSTIKMLLTSPAGTDQITRISGLYIWQSPVDGDQLTAIKLVGNADVEYILAGDVS